MVVGEEERWRSKAVVYGERVLWGETIGLAIVDEDIVEG